MADAPNIAGEYFLLSASADDGSALNFGNNTNSVRARIEQNGASATLNLISEFPTFNPADGSAQVLDRDPQRTATGTLTWDGVFFTGRVSFAEFGGLSVALQPSKSTALGDTLGGPATGTLTVNGETLTFKENGQVQIYGKLDNPDLSIVSTETDIKPTEDIVADDEPKENDGPAFDIAGLYELPIFIVPSEADEKPAPFARLEFEAGQIEIKQIGEADRFATGGSVDRRTKQSVTTMNRTPVQNLDQLTGGSAIDPIVFPAAGSFRFDGDWRVNAWHLNFQITNGNAGGNIVLDNASYNPATDQTTLTGYLLASDINAQSVPVYGGGEGRSRVIMVRSGPPSLPKPDDGVAVLPTRPISGGGTSVESFDNPWEGLWNATLRITKQGDQYVGRGLNVSFCARPFGGTLRGLMYTTSMLPTDNPRAVPFFATLDREDLVIEHEDIPAAYTTDGTRRYTSIAGAYASRAFIKDDAPISCLETLARASQVAQGDAVGEIDFLETGRDDPFDRWNAGYRAGENVWHFREIKPNVVAATQERSNTFTMRGCFLRGGSDTGALEERVEGLILDRGNVSKAIVLLRANREGGKMRYFQQFLGNPQPVDAELALVDLAPGTGTPQCSQVVETGLRTDFTGEIWPIADKMRAAIAGETP
ncbi:MAG: hypothetical protein AAGG69_13555 [Pseudomonadota bacterium]